VVLLIPFAPDSGLRPEEVRRATASQVYMERRDAIWIDDNDDFAIRGYPGFGTADDPYIIENFSISTSASCIVIENVDVHYVVRNCILRSGSRESISPGSSHALYIRGVSRGILENIHIEIGWNGIEIDSCSSVNISSCRVFDSHTGIHFSNCINMTVNGCITAGNSNRFRLTATSNSTIRNSKLYSNTLRGVYLDTSSSYNYLYHNYFGWSTYEDLTDTGFAVDDGTENCWDDGNGQGNLYYDYNGTGIVQIGGDADSVDHYPANFTDSNPPDIQPSEEIHFPPEYEYASADVTDVVVVTVHDDFPLNFSALLDGHIHSQGFWSPNTIIVKLKSLETGTHNLTILISDGAGNGSSMEFEVVKDAFSLMGFYIFFYTSLFLIGLLVILLSLRFQIHRR
jgi:parallel beta-helix repeat protein